MAQVSGDSAVNPNATTLSEVLPVVPPKRSRSGRTYYPQPPPEQRGYGNLKLRLTAEEESVFRGDAEEHGGIVAYVRYLWDQDRLRRGLAPVPHPEPKRRKHSSDGPSE